MTKTNASRCSAKVLTIFSLGLLLFGCASDYKAVREGDLAEIQLKLQAAEQALHKLEQQQAVSRDLLFLAHQESLRRVLTAVKEQVKAPECPAPEKIVTSCEAAASDTPAAPAQPSDGADGKLVIGAVESVFLDPPGKVYKARIDTGAESSSLDAREIQTFERDGENWVRFKIPAPGSSDLIDVERRVSRFVRVSQSASEGSERRPVIKMRIVIGNVERPAEFTLSDREHLEFPVLIGRNVLKDTLIVDVSRSDSVPLPDELRNRESPNE